MLNDSLVLEQRVDARLQQLGGGLEERGGIVDELAAWVGGVPFLLQGLERIDEPGVKTRRSVVGVAEVDGDAVGGLEADAVDLTGDAVGLVHHDLLRLGAVFVDELHALRGGDAVGLEENMHFAQGFLLLPGGLDGGGADLADALDLAELARLLAEDAEGVGAKVSTILLA